MIEVKNLSKRYGENVALNNISFSVGEHTVVGFLGPNGAGKSTTMNIITGYISASSGSVTVGGHSILDEPNEAKKLIGYMPEIPPLYPDMTVGEYLNFVYELKKVTLPREKHLKEICTLVRIGSVYGRLIANLSKGYRQRVGLAQALVGNPPALILDEPTVGLDPKQIIEVRNLIKSLGKDHTVLLSSHILPEVQAVADRIIIINRGRLAADGTPYELEHGQAGEQKVVVRLEGAPKQVQQALEGIHGVTHVRNFGEKEPGVWEYEVDGRGGAELRRPLFGIAAKRGWPILGMTGSELSLEDVFLRLTGSTYLSDNAQVQLSAKGGDRA
ncbi:MAG TPA: ABC transporter [Ruminococcaceae bacterium]|jgi:ABC-2 type transport system ATP-binding protein|nr:ABC transporter [Oscillospiraceae bacterium]HBG55199.1 ABC transporter [Oscillospiraceae bacterium]HBQ46807.1 ABC transporter [Oscillospiraceae bacterium]HBT91167.1 ABC transporter [Oscillospiraceae bacterium]HCB90361.1 ABC transporter [Oscillospiraceae bacterium]